VFKGDDRWRALQIPSGDTFAWGESSTYVRRPPYFDGMELKPRRRPTSTARGCWRSSATR
jgi:aconitate hydratase